MFLQRSFKLSSSFGNIRHFSTNKLEPGLITHAQSNITFKSKNGDCPAFISSHSQRANKGLIVVQEWWGLNKNIEKVADRLAKKGYLTIAPDLYRGKVAIDYENAGHLMKGLDFAKAVEDIRGAAQFLQANGCKKVGVIGFCMGGALTLLSSASVKELHGGICFHGCPPLDYLKAEDIKIPLQCHFGDLDDHKGFSDPETANQLEEKLKNAGVNVEFIRYPKCGHAFTNEFRPEVYNPAAAEIAWKNVYQWLKKFLSVY